MSGEQQVFAVANDATICAAIASCQQRLVYIAPGITEAIADAMSHLLQKVSNLALTVIIDTDPEVCRLGYGTEAGLQSLQKLANEQHLAIRYQAGVRIGVLMCDEQMWVYSPTPLLIEAGSERQDQPNALCVMAPAALGAVALACAAEGEQSAAAVLPQQAEIGRQIATPQIIANSLQDLKRQPPKPYDLARIERVYSSKLQYVDFEVNGYRLTTRRVQVPNDLLVGNDKTLETRLRNSFALLEGKTSLEVEIEDKDEATLEVLKDTGGKPLKVLYSEKRIEDERKAIYKDFLTPIAGHGQLISKARRAAFDLRIKWFEDRVKAYAKAVADALQVKVDESINDLTKALLPTVCKAPPARLLKKNLNRDFSSDDLSLAIKAELHEAFNTGERFFQPQVKVVFKDLTYETIQDKKFRQQLEEAFKGLGKNVIGDLFEEHDAAPEASS